jgi:tRNA threonylcarbamoyladenosine biosynthesis protein TsaB
MALILAVDTTGEHGSVALLRDGELLEELLLHAPTSYSPVLYQGLRALLARHDVSVAQVDCFAAASGPGTFTGVRVALACVMGLAEAVGKPAVAVSNLEAVSRYGSAALRGVALDARRSEVYGAVYDAEGRAVTEEVVAKLGAWLEGLPAGVEEFLSNDLTLDLAGTRFAHASVVEAPRAVAGAVARIAEQRFLKGEGCDPAALDANYVRRSDAELALKFTP